MLSNFPESGSESLQFPQKYNSLQHDLYLFSLQIFRVQFRHGDSFTHAILQ